MNINGKLVPVQSIIGMWEGWMKENSGRAEFKYDIFDIL
jgi:hypothetical protein